MLMSSGINDGVHAILVTALSVITSHIFQYACQTSYALTFFKSPTYHHHGGSSFFHYKWMKAI